MSNITIIIPSSDEYADTWESFIFSLRANLIIQDVIILLSSESIKPKSKEVLHIKTGKYLVWGERMHFLLKNVKTKYVLIMFEDHYLTSEINKVDFDEWEDILDKNNLAYLRLYPSSFKTHSINGENIMGRVSKFDPYNSTVPMSIWNVNILKKHIKSDYSPWDFEKIGSKTSFKIKNEFWSYKKPVIRYINAIERGSWMPNAIEYMKDNNLMISNRKLFNKSNSKTIRIYKLSKFIKLIDIFNIRGLLIKLTIIFYYLKKNKIEKIERMKL